MIEHIRYNREESDTIFTETLDYLDNLNTRDGRFEYADYVSLHNMITALYDGFSYVDEIIGEKQAEIDRLTAENEALKEKMNAMECDLYNAEMNLSRMTQEFVLKGESK